MEKTIIDITCSISNDDFTNILEVMQVSNLIIDPNYFNFCVESDERRVRFSERSLTERAKETQRSFRSFRKEENEENFNLEGQLHGAGIAE